MWPEKRPPPDFPVTLAPMIRASMEVGTSSSSRSIRRAQTSFIPLIWEGTTSIIPMAGSPWTRRVAPIWFGARTRRISRRLPRPSIPAATAIILTPSSSKSTRRGSSLLYSTFLGGVANVDGALDIALVAAVPSVWWDTRCPAISRQLPEPTTRATISELMPLFPSSILPEAP